MSLFNFQLKCDLLEYDNMGVCVWKDQPINTRVVLKKTEKDM
jgi:hypothetical protein